MLRKLLTVLAFAGLGVGCASTRPAPVGGARSGRAPSSEHGLISFYADSLAGNPMANGKPYDPGKPTCAHKSHAFGTKLAVKLDSGTETTCVVSDRGPFVRGRILDLSKSLARELGMVERGVAAGSIEVVR